MEKFFLHHPLPSCRIGKRLIAQVEKHLLAKIPRLLQKDLARMEGVLGHRTDFSLQKYSVSFRDRSETKTLASVDDYPKEKLHPSVRQISLHYRIGLPEMLALRLSLARGARPVLELETMSQSVQKIFPQLAEGISAVLQTRGNRNWIFHRRLVQTAIALLIPLAFVGFTRFMGIESFFIYASQGWLLLLAWALALILPRLFPYVSFETSRSFDVRRLLFLVLLALNLTAICAYVGLLAYQLDLLRI